MMNLKKCLKAEARKKDPNYGAMADQAFARDLMQPSEVRTLRSEIGIYTARSLPLRFFKMT
jgi:hypothetical protein